jgi:outer membrane lipopolysaccharide assembly protein LptE/RlpB
MAMNTRTLSLLALLVTVLLIANCGYSVHRKADLPFTEIMIGKIENKTLEPKLQDKLQLALTEEFEKNGISVTPGAKNRITGVIHNIDMISLSEKDGTTVEYRIIVTADFTFHDAGGTVKEIKKAGSPFIVSFSGSQDMGNLLANRDQAERKAMADVAMKVVGELIYP